MNYLTIKASVVKVAKVIGDTYLSDDTSISSVEDIIEGNEEDENYVLVAMLLKLTHVNHDKQEDSSSKVNTFKKQKRNYDRILQFGDTSGNVFCIIYERESHSSRGLKYCADMIAVGTTFLLIEPKLSPSGQTLRTDMPVMETSLPLVPLSDRIMRFWPQVPCRPPTEANETTFFLLQQLSLEIKSADFRGKGDIHPASCMGLLCDRQNILKASKSCGCLVQRTQGSSSGIVLECTITSLINPEENRFFSIHYYRSYRLTSLMVKNPETVAILQQTERISRVLDLRKAIKLCYTHINSHDGFTVGGYITRGEIADASDATHKIDSEKVHYHLAYVFPSRFLLDKDTNYCQLKYKYQPSQFDAATNETKTNS